jgi:hypothetical protein
MNPIDNKSLLAITATAFLVAIASSFVMAQERDDGQFLSGRIVAIGISGISAVSPVGTFLPGGPIHDKPGLAAFTQPGRVLDPARILVASTSNFGEPLANADQSPGSLLSIDPQGADIIVVPANFAAAGGQVSAQGGSLQMFSAQNAAFLNSINTPGAATATFTGVSNPLGLSINNAFGRLWPANAPFGLSGIGSSTILDPGGLPLAGAPDPQVGGVFAADLTPRLPSQAMAGALDTGAAGTAFLGHSPDGSARAVFAVVAADGSIVQEHTGKGLDGLAPAGTVRALLGHEPDRGENDGSVTPRLGVLLNYSPTRILYVSEPFGNTIAALDLSDDGTIFHVTNVRRFHSEALNEPVDLAPVVNETSDNRWASNTTLDVQSDFYVANHGNNTIVRMTQTGAVVAVRRVRLADSRTLGSARLNGIAISTDFTKIWVTVTGGLPGYEDHEGAVLELPAF